MTEGKPEWPGDVEHWQTSSEQRAGCLGIMAAAVFSVLLWALLYLAWRAW